MERSGVGFGCEAEASMTFDDVSATFMSWCLFFRHNFDTIYAIYTTEAKYDVNVMLLFDVWFYRDTKNRKLNVQCTHIDPRIEAVTALALRKEDRPSDSNWNQSANEQSKSTVIHRNPWIPIVEVGLYCNGIKVYKSIMIMHKWWAWRVKSWRPHASTKWISPKYSRLFQLTILSRPQSNWTPHPFFLYINHCNMNSLGRNTVGGLCADSSPATPGWREVYLPGWRNRPCSPPRLKHLPKQWW